MRRGSVLLALPLAACVSAGPRVPTPVAAGVVAPSGWRSAGGQGAAVTAEWWTRFGDPALSALVARALANNVDVAVAAARVEEARAAEALARAQLSPQV